MSDVVDEILESLKNKLFNVPIMSNLYRPHYVEHMIAIGLGEGFQLMSGDWGGWDIDGQQGKHRLRIEIKQSAALQTWTNHPSRGGKLTRGSFDIAPRTGYFDESGAVWVPDPGRHAEIYILAWHPITDETKADHRDPAQWLFFIIPTNELPPDQKTISRTVVEKSWPAVRFEQLRQATLNTAKQLFKK